MLVFRPVSLLEPVDQKSLTFSFENDIDYQDDEGSDGESKSTHTTKKKYHKN